MKYKLSEIMELIGGGTPKTSIPEYWNGDIPWLSVKDFNNDFRYVYDTEKSITEEGLLHSSTKLLQKGDVIISARGTVGEVASIPFPMAFNQSCYGLRAKRDIITEDYLYYLLKYNVTELKRKTHGSVFDTITRETFDGIEVIIPSIGEQTKIASMLSVLDEKIQLNTEINKNLLKQVIALYEHFIQEFDWPIVTIQDIAEKVAMGPFGSNIKVSTFVSEGVPIISGNHLRGHFLEETEFNYITEEHAERLKNSIVFSHDIIFTHAGNIGQVAMIPDGCKYNRYVLSQRQFYLRCDETKVVPELLLMFFHSTLGQHELLSYANQTGVPSIARPASNLKKIPFMCPPIQEQLLWQKQIHPFINSYLINRLENERLSALRDTLLPKLMSGELDISSIDL